jgi:hypothetical protein
LFKTKKWLGNKLKRSYALSFALLGRCYYSWWQQYLITVYQITKKNLNYKWAYSYSLIYSPKDRPSHHGERPKDWK